VIIAAVCGRTHTHRHGMSAHVLLGVHGKSGLQDVIARRQLSHLALQPRISSCGLARFGVALGRAADPHGIMVAGAFACPLVGSDLRARNEGLVTPPGAACLARSVSADGSAEVSCARLAMVVVFDQTASVPATIDFLVTRVVDIYANTLVPV